MFHDSICRRQSFNYVRRFYPSHLRLPESLLWPRADCVSASGGRLIGRSNPHAGRRNGSKAIPRHKRLQRSPDRRRRSAEWRILLQARHGKGRKPSAGDFDYEVTTRSTHCTRPARGTSAMEGRKAKDSLHLSVEARYSPSAAYHSRSLRDDRRRWELL